MIDFNKVFLDTSPVVYYLENSEPYYLRIKNFLMECVECDLFTSTVTVTEYLTYPYQQRNLKAVNDFYAFYRRNGYRVKKH